MASPCRRQPVRHLVPSHRRLHPARLLACGWWPPNVPRARSCLHGGGCGLSVPPSRGLTFSLSGGSSTGGRARDDHPVRALLRPVTGKSTWARVLHLAIGLWFAVACALVWPGLPDASLRSLAGLYLAPLPLLAVLACVPAVRRSEGVQAGALLLPGDDQITVESSRTWSDRARLLGWLIARVELGVLAGQLTVLAATTAWSLLHPTTVQAHPPGWAA